MNPQEKHKKLKEYLENKNKRFYIIESSLRYNCIVDKEKQGNGNCYDGVLYFDDVVYQLNDLHEENKLLKQFNNCLIKILAHNDIKIDKYFQFQKKREE